MKKLFFFLMMLCVLGQLNANPFDSYIYYYRNDDGRALGFEFNSDGTYSSPPVLNKTGYTDWDIVFPYTVGNDTYIYYYRNEDGRTAAFKFNCDGTYPSTPVFNVLGDTNWDIIFPYTVGSDTYIYYYSNDNGRAVAFKFNSDGTYDPTFVFNKTGYTNWDIVFPYTVGSETYIYYYRTYDGRAAAFKFNSDGTYSGPPVFNILGDKNWDIVFPYTVGSDTYIYYYRNDDGRAVAFKFNSGGIPDPTPVFNKYGDKNWDIIFPYTVGSDTYIYYYRTHDGRAVAFKFNSGGIPDPTPVFNKYGDKNWDIIFPYYLACSPPTNPCDSILTTYSSAPDSLGYCCFDIYIENTADQYFTNIVFKPFNGTFASWQVDDPSAWDVSSLGSNVLNLEALPGPFIPTGNYQPITFCLDNYTAPPQQVQVEWVANDGTRCSDVLTFDCAPPPEPCPTVDTIVNHEENCCYEMTLNNINTTPIGQIIIDITGPAGVSFDANSVTPFFNTAVSTNQIIIDNYSAPFPTNTVPLVNFCLNSTTITIYQSFEIKYFDINGKPIYCTQEIKEGCELLPTDTCCADSCEFFDRVNAPILTNAPHADGCKLGITTVALNDCDQVTIDWGDGIIEGPFPPGNVVGLSHVYANPGNYEVIMYVKEIGADGKPCWEGVSRIQVKADCEEERTEESQEVVFQNYPNPFSDQTTIEFTLTKDAPVTLLVFDSMGRQIATLLDNEPTTGAHQVIFDGTDYPSGVYYYTIQAGGFFGTQKMTLIK